MKKIIFGFAFLSISLSTEASLIGRLEATPGAGDYQAYYDDVADLTWLANANVAGAMKWGIANAWAANLDIDGVTGWRLPTTLQPDSSCYGPMDFAYLNYHCMGSEMGNMYYNVLGGVAGQSINTTHNSNYDLFSNIASFEYWSSTEDVLAHYYSKAWAFYFVDGGQLSYNNGSGGNNLYAWAVRDGDVYTASTVPLPTSAWLFGSGLLALLGVTRKLPTHLSASTPTTQ